jgi:formyl-CoA transferase
LHRFQSFDVPFSSGNGISEVFDDPQVRHLDSFYTLRHPAKGELISIRRPVRLDGGRGDQGAIPPPMLGEHTDEVLRELRLAGSTRAGRTAAQAERAA